MSRRHRRWVRVALSLAKSSNHPTHRMSAIVVRGGNVVSKAFNVVKSPHTLNLPNHAEARALRNKGSFEGSTIYIVRNNCRMSKPCPHCLAKIREAGIAKVIYFDWSGNMVQESP